MKRSGGKLLAAAMVALGLVLVITLLYYQQGIVSRAQEQAYQVLLDSANEQTATFSAKLSGQFAVLRTLACTLGEEASADPEAVRSRMQAVTDTSDFMRLILSDECGRAFTNDGKSLNIARRDYFLAALRGEECITKVTVGILDGKAHFLLAVPVMRGGSVIGALCGSFEEDIFRSLLVSQAYARTGYSLIVDGRHAIIVGSDASSYVNNGGTILQIFRGDPKEDGVPFDADTFSLRRRQSGLISYHINGQHRYAVFRALDINDWVLFSVIPDYVLDDEVTGTARLGYRMILLVAVVILSLLVFIVLLNRRKNAQLASERAHLRISEEDYRIAAEQSGKLVMRFNTRTGSVTQHGAAPSLFSFDRVMNGLPESLIRSGLILPESHQAFRTFYEAVKRGDPSGSTLLHLRRSNGSFPWMRSDFTTVLGEDGKPLHSIVSFTDVTDQYEKEIAYEKDPLTGALIRPSFIRQALYKIEKSPDAAHVFLLIDVDHFKQINDTLGHIHGDELLTSVVRDLKKELRAADLIGRIGGDEFMIFMQDVPNDAIIARRAEALRKAIDRTVGDIAVSASLGISVYPRDGRTFEALYNKADLALYSAKFAGRDCFRIYDPALGARDRENQSCSDSSGAGSGGRP